MKRLVLLAAGLSLAAVAPASAAPSPGAAGLGDRLNPGSATVATTSTTTTSTCATPPPRRHSRSRATLTIVARATQDLSRFNLDFGGGAVGGVSVNGKTRALRAPRGGTGDHAEPVAAQGRRVRGPRVALHRDADRAQRRSPSTGFFVTRDGSATAPQPYFAHLIYPSNDHPRDKASFSFRIDVPAGTTAVANGLPLGKLPTAGALRGCS